MTVSDRPISTTSSSGCSGCTRCTGLHWAAGTLSDGQTATEEADGTAFQGRNGSVGPAPPYRCTLPARVLQVHHYRDHEFPSPNPSPVRLLDLSISAYVYLAPEVFPVPSSPESRWP